MKATAAVLYEYDQPLTMTEVFYAPLADHEVLIEVRASGVCRSDLSVSLEDHGFSLPMILGHEVAGIVTEVGAGVQSLAVGDHVVACPVNHCGKCTNCRTGKPYRCLHPETTMRGNGDDSRVSIDNESVTQFIGIGGFATHTVVHENLAVAVSHEVPFAIAALLGCGVLTGMGAALNTADIRRGDTVAVIGCGGVGLNVIQGARLAGAQRIIAVDRNPEAIALALELGATHGVDPREQDLVTVVMEATNGVGVTHAFEVVGLPETVHQAMDCLEVGGTVYLVGVQAVGTHLELPWQHFFNQKGIRGLAMGSSIPHVHIPRYADLYLQGRLQLDQLVANRIRLEDINEGLARIKHGALARSVITFDGLRP